MTAPAVIDVRRIRHRTSAILADGTEVVLPRITDRTREETDAEFSQRVTLAMQDVRLGSYGMASDVLMPGTKLLSRVSYDAGETWDDDDPFLGTVVKWTPKDKQGRLTIEAGDDLALLYGEGADVEVFYTAGTIGRDIIAATFDAFSIPVARLDGPSAAMPKILFSGKAGELILAVLQHALWMGDKCYLPRMRNGKVEVVIPGDNPRVYRFLGTSNVNETDASQSIERTANEVDVAGLSDPADDQTRPEVAEVASDGSDEHAAGIVRRKAIRSAKLTDADSAKAAAATTLDKASAPDFSAGFTGLDAPPIHKGDILYAEADRLADYYTISAVSHSDGPRTMHVRVVAKDAPLYKAQRFEDRQKKTGAATGKGLDGLFAWCRAHLGIPYVWGGKDASGYDCSGFTAAAFREALGVDIGAGTGGQWAQNPAGDGAPGDLVFFDHTAMVEGKWTDHVGIVGPDPGMMFHAGNPSQYAQILSVKQPRGYRRPVDFSKQAAASDVPLEQAPADLAAAVTRYFPADARADAIRVSQCETRGWTNFHNTVYPDDSHGYFQINILAHGGTVAYWMDADNNVRKASELWRAAGGSFARDWVRCSARLGLS